MDGMGIMEEWMASILKNGTKLHHERGMRYFLEYMKSARAPKDELERNDGLCEECATMLDEDDMEGE